MFHRPSGRVAMPLVVVVLLVVLGIADAATLWATDSDDDDEPLPPGLQVEFTAAGTTVERIDPGLSYDWSGASPDARLPAGPFRARWSGQLLMRPTTKYQFHAWVRGDVTVQIDGETVLADERKTAGWVSGPKKEWKAGEHEIQVDFRSRPATEDQAKGATLRLFWSSDTFPIEPLPEHQLFQSDRRLDLDVAERGRRDFVRHRCGRCHVRPNDAPPPAPDLTQLGGALDPAWIAAKLDDATPRAAGSVITDSRMPVFGFTRDESEAVAAFLLSAAKTPKLDTLPTIKPADVETQRKAGATLFKSVGCAGCHTSPVTELPRRRKVPDDQRLPSDVDPFEHQPLAGGDLIALGDKRSAEWIYTWMSKPEMLNADHRMPVFALSDTERVQLARWLESLRSSNTSPTIPGERLTDPERIALGKRLVQEARCAACHRIPGIDPPKPASDLTRVDNNWTNACTQAAPDTKTRRPGFPHLFDDATKVYVTQFATATHPLAPDIAGRNLLERNNCLGCHDRGVQKGLSGKAAALIRGDESLRGQSEGLIPPSLTAVGDKLLDAALSDAVTGGPGKPRLPWLRVRMPRFRHTADEKAALVAHLKTADRIPDGAPSSKPGTAANVSSGATPISAERLLLGQQLVGPGGFSCIACHEIGRYKPKNVALGTRGSDLLVMAGRMRKEFYLRWTRSPARIVPGMEMPSYQKPVPGVLDETIDTQLMAIWDAVNDARFVPPTNPVAVEQFLVVGPGEPARVVRDVFSIPKEFGASTVPRSFAVGLNNGHSLLFDLDTFTLRQWTFGDFARQRTEGKSWYWDMAGTPVIRAASPASDFALRAKGSDERLVPQFVGAGAGTLRGYERLDDGVAISYRVRWTLPKSGAPIEVDIQEMISPDTPTSSAPLSRLRRIVRAARIPEGYELLLATHQSADALGGGMIVAAGRSDATWIDPPEAAALSHAVRRRLTTFVPADEPHSARLELHYDVRLESKRLPHPLRPSLTASPEPITTVPGFQGRRLPIETSIMPTAIAWTKDGRLAFASLKGHVGLVNDTDGDGVEDRVDLIEEGLAAPYGLIAHEDDLLVAHKPEVLRLKLPRAIALAGNAVDGAAAEKRSANAGRVVSRTVFATGWGYSDNYHDWTCGFARDNDGNLFVGLGSDYSDSARKKENALWRGKVVRIDRDGRVTPVASAFRYPTGLAIDGAGRLFATDNQGVQNTHNELNLIQPGRSYGVPSKFEEQPDAPETPPALRIPHPWTRSVNGIVFLPPVSSDANANEAKRPPDDPRFVFAGHGLGCEYDTRFLVRFTIQQVDDVVQGAVYPFSLPEQGAGRSNFTGPLSIGVSPAGDIYVGSIHDSGWLGGLNTGDIVRLRPNGKLPNGVAEMKAVPKGFEITFVRPVDKVRAADPASYTLLGATRQWKGAYATPDSGRHNATIDGATVSDDGRRVTLKTNDLKEGHLYELNVGAVGSDDTPLFPAVAFYTLHRAPRP